MIETVVRVGIADTKIAFAPEKIKTLGLGSCVGVVIYDGIKQIAGLTHIMLPDSQIARVQESINRAKFADTGISDLYNQLIQIGCNPRQLKAKIAGGAQMFQFQSQNDQMRIGARNIEAVRNSLMICQIPVIAEDVGGHVGRTIEFDPVTQKLTVKKAQHGLLVI